MFFIIIISSDAQIVPIWPVSLTSESFWPIFIICWSLISLALFCRKNLNSTPPRTHWIYSSMWNNFLWKLAEQFLRMDKQEDLTINLTLSMATHNQEVTYKPRASTWGVNCSYPHQTPQILRPLPERWAPKTWKPMGLTSTRPKRLWWTERCLFKGSCVNSLPPRPGAEAAIWKVQTLCKIDSFANLKASSREAGSVGILSGDEGEGRHHFHALALPC